MPKQNFPTAKVAASIYNTIRRHVTNNSLEFKATQQELLELLNLELDAKKLKTISIKSINHVLTGTRSLLPVAAKDRPKKLEAWIKALIRLAEKADFSSAYQQKIRNDLTNAARQESESSKIIVEDDSFLAWGQPYAHHPDEFLPCLRTLLDHFDTILSSYQSNKHLAFVFSSVNQYGWFLNSSDRTAFREAIEDLIRIHAHKLDVSADLRFTIKDIFSDSASNFKPVYNSEDPADLRNAMLFDFVLMLLRASPNSLEINAYNKDFSPLKPKLELPKPPKPIEEYIYLEDRGGYLALSTSDNLNNEVQLHSVDTLIPINPDNTTALERLHRRFMSKNPESLIHLHKRIDGLGYREEINEFYEEVRQLEQQATHGTWMVNRSFSDRTRPPEWLTIPTNFAALDTKAHPTSWAAYIKQQFYLGYQKEGGSFKARKAEVQAEKHIIIQLERQKEFIRRLENNQGEYREIISERLLKDFLNPDTFNELFQTYTFQSLPNRIARLERVLELLKYSNYHLAIAPENNDAFIKIRLVRGEERLTSSIILPILKQDNTQFSKFIKEHRRPLDNNSDTAIVGWILSSSKFCQIAHQKYQRAWNELLGIGQNDDPTPKLKSNKDAVKKRIETVLEELKTKNNRSLTTARYALL
jgi:hypothetical protein